MSNQSEVILIFPPQFPPFQPHLALPSLNASLRLNGVGGRALDLNVEFYHYCLSPDLVREAVLQLEGQVASGKEAPIDILGYLSTSEIVLSELTFSVRRLSGLEPAGIPELLRAQKVANRALQLVSRSYGFRLSLQELTLENPRATQGYASLLRRFMESGPAKVLRRAGPAVVGMSIATHQQRVGSQVLANCIREILPSVNIVVGGSIPTLYSSVPAVRWYFRSWADQIFVGESEETLVRYSQEVLGKATCRSVRTSDTDRLIHPDVSPDISALPTPSYEGLPLNKYLSPRAVLPLTTARGCAWRRCTFCSHSYVYGSGYRARPLDAVASDIKELLLLNPGTYLSLYDEFIPLTRLRALADIIGNWETGWSAYTRFNGNWSKATVKALSHSGCRLLSFGLESGSDRVLADMDKGIDRKMILRGLDALDGSSIWTHLYLILGFPTESSRDFEQTLELVNIYKNRTVSFGPSGFGLAPGSEIAGRPGRYDIVNIHVPDDPFSGVPFQTSNGINPQTIRERVGLVWSALGERWWQRLEFVQVLHLLPLCQHDCNLVGPIAIEMKS